MSTLTCKFCEGPHPASSHFLFSSALQLYEVARVESDGSTLTYGVLVERGIVVGGAPRVAPWVGSWWLAVQKNLHKRGASIRQLEIQV